MTCPVTAEGRREDERKGESSEKSNKTTKVKKWIDKTLCKTERRGKKNLVVKTS